MVGEQLMELMTVFLVSTVITVHSASHSGHGGHAGKQDLSNIIYFCVTHIFQDCSAFLQQQDTAYTLKGHFISSLVCHLKFVYIFYLESRDKKPTYCSFECHGVFRLENLFPNKQYYVKCEFKSPNLISLLRASDEVKTKYSIILSSVLIHLKVLFDMIRYCWRWLGDFTCALNDLFLDMFYVNVHIFFLVFIF